MYAASKGQTGVIQELLKAGGVDINARDSDGKTALILATDSGHSKAIMVLLDEGADKLVQDNKEGETAFDVWQRKWRKISDLLRP